MATNNSIDNTSLPFATTALTIDPGASGDSYVQFDINTTNEFRLGVDDDASDTFKISQGGALGTNDTFIITAAGERTMPLQTAFLAVPSSTLSSVTGDGTNYVVVFGSETFDQNSDFSSTTFTAPVNGLYFFQVSLHLDNISTSYTDLVAQFNYNAGTVYPFFQCDPSTGIQITGDEMTFGGQIGMYMTASQTMTIELDVAGSTKSIDILTDDTWFSGYLAC